MKVALIIGHNQRAEGAYSQILGREYNYWKGIAEKIKTKIKFKIKNNFFKFFIFYLLIIFLFYLVILELSL